MYLHPSVVHGSGCSQIMEGFDLGFKGVVEARSLHPPPPPRLLGPSRDTGGSPWPPCTDCTIVTGSRNYTVVNTEKGLMEVQRMSCAGMKLSCQLKVQNSLWTATEVTTSMQGSQRGGQRSPHRGPDLANKNIGCPGTLESQIAPAYMCETPKAVPAALRSSSVSPRATTCLIPGG